MKEGTNPNRKKNIDCCQNDKKEQINQHYMKIWTEYQKKRKTKNNVFEVNENQLIGDLNGNLLFRNNVITRFNMNSVTMWREVYKQK